ncbi:hypothetical protein [Streptomyces sp. NPDC050600]|uniref:hypothetical protein n=1 Tax=Streptomyces sp. NPDC050600 TaxID=3157213 RepID=UPI00342BA330
MSRETGRETDSSSSGAQARGGAAYPSGTPPYGIRPGQEAREETPAASAPPEEPKTETTLTTRIRINIPGSRPIPPVVVRKPVADAAPDVQAQAQAQAKAQAQAPAPVAEPEPPRPEPVPEPEPVTPAEPPRAEEKPTSDWFAPRKPAAAAPAPKPAAALPPGPGPVTPAPAPAAAAPGFAGGSASDGVPSAASTTQSMPIVTPLTGGPGHTPAGGTPVFDPGAGNPLYDSGPGHTPAAGTPVVTPPSGPTTGPVTGRSPVVGPGHRQGGAPAHGMPGVPGMPGMTDALRMSDDTAILTPQSPAPHDGAHVSGATLTSGIQAVPPTATPGPDTAPRIPERQAAPFDGGYDSYDEPDAYDEPAPAPARKPAPAPAKKGRSKLVLAGVGVVVLAGVAYGAGLLLNHSDVPKGTTVLGVDIGGGTKEEAVTKLETALGKRAHAPLQLDVGGKKTELAPDKAGLALDAQETVRAAAGSDYNPVSVIGSLFGGQRVAQPVFPVDEEKLGVALTDLAGSSGSATEGTILFTPGKVTAVEGKPGKSLDVQRSMIAVKDAYRAQVETGTAKSVALPVVTRQPTVTKAELDRAMKDFAEPAMSGLIRIKAGTKKIDFGPARSLPKILSMRAVDGKLVEVYNKEAITELLDGVFAGVMITKGDGSKHEVSADDVAFVMRDALRGKGLAERTKTIDLNGEG